MKVRAKKEFSGARWGNVSIGNWIDVSVEMARQLISAGLVEEVEVDSMGKQKPLSSLQVDQVPHNSNLTTSSDSETLESAKSSQSTQATEPQIATSSTPVIASGGKSTQKPQRTSKKGGRKTSGQQTNTV